MDFFRNMAKKVRTIIKLNLPAGVATPAPPVGPALGQHGVPIMEFIKEYNKQYKATILLTSHYMRDVEALCRRVIIINHGKLLFDGKLSDLVKRHAPYRIVKLTLQKNIDESLMRGLGEIKSFTYPQVVISVPYRRISDVSAKILKDLAVQDLIIEEPEIEDIIREIFEKGKS